MVEERKMAGRRRLAVVRALLWEQWRQTRLVLLLPLAFAAFGTAVSYVWNGFHPAATFSHDILIADIVISFVLYFCAALVMPFSHCEATNLQAGLPQRLYALPVRPSLLAMLYVGYRTLAIILVGAALVGLTYLTPNFYAPLRENIAFNVVVIALFFAHAQACLWTVGFVHIGLAGVASLGLFFPLLLGYQVMVCMSPLGRAGIVPAYAPLVAIWLVAPIIGSMLERRGTWTALRAFLGTGLPTLERKRPPFVSLSEAQRWFEWRRKGRIFPTTTACFMAPFLTFLAFVAYQKFRHPSQIALDIESYFVLAFSSTTLASIITGLLLMALDYRDHATGFAAFTMTRCIGTREMALDRMRVAARSVALTYGCLLALAVPWLAFTSSFGAFDAMVHEVAGPGVKAYGLLGLAVVGCATLNWAVISFLGPLLAIAGVVWIFAMAFMTEEYVAVLLLGLSVVLLLSLLVWAFRAATHRRMPGPFADRRTPWVYLALCGCLCALFFLLIRVASMPEADRWDVALGFGLWCLASLACLVPLFVMPVWVHWLRHR